MKTLLTQRMYQIVFSDTTLLLNIYILIFKIRYIKKYLDVFSTFSRIRLLPPC